RILPGLSRVDERRVYARLSEPAQDRGAHEFGTIIGAEIARGAMDAHQLLQHLNHATGPDPAGDIDRETLARPLVDDRQTLQRLPVGAPVTRSRTPRRDSLRSVVAVPGG